MGGWQAFVAKSLTVQSVRDDILLEPWVWFAVRISLKEIATHWPSQTNSMYANSHLLKSDVSGQKAQIYYVTVNITQQIPLYGHPAIIGSLRMNEWRRRT